MNDNDSDLYSGAPGYTSQDASAHYGASGA